MTSFRLTQPIFVNADLISEDLTTAFFQIIRAYGDNSYETALIPDQNRLRYQININGTETNRYLKWSINDGWNILTNYDQDRVFIQSGRTIDGSDTSLAVAATNKTIGKTTRLYATESGLNYDYLDTNGDLIWRKSILWS